MRCGPAPTMPFGCECIPPGTEDGQILVWDGTGWVPSSRGEVIPPGAAVGEVLVWDGAAWVPSNPELQPGARPWQGAWGTPNFGGQTLFYMQNVNWTGAVITAATLAANPHIVNYIFPKQGGKLKYIAAEIIGATVAPSQVTTYTVWVDGAATALAVSLAAALNASDCAFVDVTIPAAAVNHRVMIQVTAPANPGSGATIPNRVHVGGWVNA